MMRELMNSWTAQANYLVAIQNGNVEGCAALLAEGADADQTFRINSVIRPALCLGVERGTYDLVELLLRNGVAINRRDSKGNTSLHVAVEMGYESIVELLLLNKADVNAADNQLVTPIHTAAKRGHLSITSRLLSYGADIHRRDINGKSPLAYACASPNVNKDVVKLLLDQGATPDDPEGFAYSPLQCILLSPNFDIETVKLLVSKNANVDALTRDGNSPIHIVVLSNNASKWECLKLFIKKGCDANLCNQMGQSPMHLACLMSDIESVRILLQAGCNPNSVDRLGISPLAYCITNGMEAFAHLLIDGGAKEDLSQISLVRLKESFRTTIQKRMQNPPSLKALARISLVKGLNSELEDWLLQNQSELPRTLVPYLLYKSSG